MMPPFGFGSLGFGTSTRPEAASTAPTMQAQCDNAMGPHQLQLALHELVIERDERLYKAVLIAEHGVEKDQETLQGDPGLESRDRDVDVAGGR